MELKIVQYNVHKSRDVMILLTADKSVAKYDVLAIQEPAKNPTIHATYCESNSAFRPLYPTNRHTRACFLINKRLPLEYWSVEFPGPDLAILTLRLPGRTVTITNVYSQPVAAHQKDENSPIYRLPDILERAGEHILVGDFNLHHPTWSGNAQTRASRMAYDLLALTDHVELVLVTPPGLITWRRSENSSSSSTIDLMFLSKTLAQHLVSCQVDNTLQHGSDHRPVAAHLTPPTDGPLRLPGPRRLWKRTDKEAVRAGSEHLWVPASFITRGQIDSYTQYLQEFALQLVDLTTPMAKTHPGDNAPCCSWWSEEIEGLIREERRARRQGQTGEQQKEISHRKKKAIKNAKRADWRRAVHEAKDGRRGIWGLVRWGKERSHLPPELPTIPPLEKGNGELAMTFEEKTAILHARFFPPEPDADLSDMQGYTYPAELEEAPQITREMVAAALANTAPFKAPGVDGIPTGFLQAMGEPLVQAIRVLTQACWDWQHVPEAFRIARTVVLRKPGKESYSQAKAWRPIALLNTLGKVMEAVTAHYLQDLAERYNLLPETQMGARKNRSTETALDLLLSQIRATWSAEGIATVLSMDISGAFDHVVRDRMIHILRGKGVPASIVGWVQSFMSDRRTTLVFDGQESAPLEVAAGIPQGSPISPILFLFYNSELLDICNPQTMRVHGLGFVDDVNLVAWGSTTRGNCDNLERLHGGCLEWARRHGAKFAPEKYELMHLTQRPRRFDTTQALQLGEVTIKPTRAVRVLGLHLDPSLRWTAHKEKTLGRMATQMNALTRLTGSTWGLPMLQARQVYTMVVRPAMAYAAHVWHQPAAERGQGLGLTRKLQKIQNKSLRIVTGGYKATPIQSLETLAHVPPLDLFLTSKVAAYRRRARDNGTDAIVARMCTRIRNTLRKPRAPIAVNVVSHPCPTKDGWIEEWMGTGDLRCAESHTQEGRGVDKRRAQRALLAKWMERWQAAPRSAAEAVSQPPDRRVLALHKGLHKAESSVLTQLRTGKIGLADFLHKAGVPEVESTECSCGQGRETPRHITVFCPRYRDARKELRVGGHVDFNELLTTAEGVRKVTRWWIKRGILEQFRLASELIHDSDGRA